eukprot:403332560
MFAITKKSPTRYGNQRKELLFNQTGTSTGSTISSSRNFNNTLQNSKRMIHTYQAISQKKPTLKAGSDYNTVVIQNKNQSNTSSSQISNNQNHNSSIGAVPSTTAQTKNQQRNMSYTQRVRPAASKSPPGEKRSQNTSLALDSKIFRQQQQNESQISQNNSKIYLNYQTSQSNAPSKLQTSCSSTVSLHQQLQSMSINTGRNPASNLGFHHSENQIHFNRSRQTSPLGIKQVITPHPKLLEPVLSANKRKNLVHLQKQSLSSQDMSLIKVQTILNENLPQTQIVIQDQQINHRSAHYKYLFNSKNSTESNNASSVPQSQCFDQMLTKSKKQNVDKQIHPNPNKLVKAKILKPGYQDDDFELLHPEQEDEDNQIKQSILVNQSIDVPFKCFQQKYLPKGMWPKKLSDINSSRNSQDKENQGSSLLTMQNLKKNLKHITQEMITGTIISSNQLNNTNDHSEEQQQDEVMTYELYNKYLKEKQNHQATKKVLDKAIGLASVLLKEIQSLEMKQQMQSPSRISNVNPLMFSVDTMRSLEPANLLSKRASIRDDMKEIHELTRMVMKENQQ